MTLKMLRIWSKITKARTFIIKNLISKNILRFPSKKKKRRKEGLTHQCRRNVKKVRAGIKAHILSGGERETSLDGHLSMQRVLTHGADSYKWHKISNIAKALLQSELYRSPLLQTYFVGKLIVWLWWSNLVIAPPAPQNRKFQNSTWWAMTFKEYQTARAG